ncbi:ribosomal protein 63, mitochondrial [Prionailurus viverrinus]|uniref:ribosomal protein 63, mitochondrial n=1 Tax=Prionailurus viverrinus TaxID=61388 RepID=UPI001FF69558|nr:ribosomal protein 63, mitochondrial [Prionailurus viverrinus]
MDKDCSAGRRTRADPTAPVRPATSLNLLAPETSRLRGGRTSPLSRELRSRAKRQGGSGRRTRFRGRVRWRAGEVVNDAAGTMFVTALLLRNRIPGSQWIGKHRRPRAVSFHAKQNMIRRLEIEAENHYWLSMPYLTAEQEYGHAAGRRAAAFEAIKAASVSKFPPHRFVVDRLDHLNVTKKWS